MAPKYKNKRCDLDGLLFASMAERNRYSVLKLFVLSGAISDLRTQVPFVLCESVIIAGRKRPALRYYADFVYTNAKTGMQVVEDVKGKITEGYRIKRHLMKAIHGIDIMEIRQK